MVFSDDVSAVSYVVSLLLLGELPWETCKSEEAILKRKQSTALEEELKAFPEVLDFVTTFKSRNTDEIDYAKWTKRFRAAAQRASPNGTNADYLPLLSNSNRTNTKRKSVSQVEKKEIIPRKQSDQEVIQRKQNAQEVIPRKQSVQEVIPRKQSDQKAIQRKQNAQEVIPRKQSDQKAIQRKQNVQKAIQRKQNVQETIQRKQNAQEIINDSPLSMKRRLSLKRPSEASKKETSSKHSPSKQSEKKIQPTRIQPKRACKRSYPSSVSLKRLCSHSSRKVIPNKHTIRT